MVFIIAILFIYFFRDADGIPNVSVLCFGLLVLCYFLVDVANGLSSGDYSFLYIPGLEHYKVVAEG